MSRETAAMLSGMLSGGLVGFMADSPGSLIAGLVVINIANGIQYFSRDRE